ncbi:MAG: hypothetical protein IKM65_07830, partial [Bacteroidaceae bacterium]|nr:hypothetical protein [Bacteroidaceae bacterium]
MRLFSLSFYTLGLTFFPKKSKQKKLHLKKLSQASFAREVGIPHSVGGLLVISVYDCFKGAADRPHLVACKQ